MDNLIERDFMLGITVAEHVHGVRSHFRDGTSDRILETLQALVRGDLTLVDTPEEIAAESNLPASIHAKLPEILRDSRTSQRESAKLVLESMFGAG